MEATGTVFLEFSEDLYMVCNNDFIYNLVKLSVDGPMAHLVVSYLSERYFCTRVGATKSTARSVFPGVAQGSLLGPDLFDIFMTDLSREHGTSLTVYANDPVVYTACRNEMLVDRRLQRAVDRIAN